MVVHLDRTTVSIPSGTMTCTWLWAQRFTALVFELGSGGTKRRTAVGLAVLSLSSPWRSCWTYDHFEKTYEPSKNYFYNFSTRRTLNAPTSFSLGLVVYFKFSTTPYQRSNWEDPSTFDLSTTTAITKCDVIILHFSFQSIVAFDWLSLLFVFVFSSNPLIQSTSPSVPAREQAEQSRVHIKPFYWMGSPSPFYSCDEMHPLAPEGGMVAPLD